MELLVFLKLEREVIALTMRWIRPSLNQAWARSFPFLRINGTQTFKCLNLKQTLRVMMARHLENTGFICKNCNKNILPISNGSYRNHCPFCLHSIHLDLIPGDRASSCRGLMKPLHLTYKSKKGWQIIHICLSCGCKKACRVAMDTIQPDSYKMLALVNQGQS